MYREQIGGCWREQKWDGRNGWKGVPHPQIKKIKKKKILQDVKTWINLEDIKLSERIQTQKEKYCMEPLVWG